MRILVASLLLTLGACSSAPLPSAVPPQPPAVKLADWTPSIALADTALAGGAPGLAVQISDQLLASNPRDTQALVRRGNALFALGRSSEAAGNFNSALEIDSGSIPAMLGLGRIQLSQDPVAAELLFAKVITREPRNGVALSNLGVARDLQGHHAAAQEAYRLALGVTPASVPVLVNLGLSLALSGDNAGSLKLLQPLAAAPGADARVRQDLALALTLGGRRSEASSMLSADLTADQARGTLDGFEALRR